MLRRGKRRDTGSKRPRIRRRKHSARLVYTKWDAVEKKTVVIKRYRRKAQAAREARAMKAYGQSPYLVRFHRFFTRRGKGHIVMERVEGSTLRAVIKSQGALRPRIVIDLALGILEGLKTLHDAGYVHGDLHSGNVIVSNLDPAKLKIIDFQHAVRKGGLGKARARRKLKRPPAMLAPESRGRLVDDRYDIYGVGFMCACMLRGRELRKRPKKPKSVGESKALWKVVRKATHKQPSKRYDSAFEMMEALRVAARRAPGDAVGRREISRHPPD